MTALRVTSRPGGQRPRARRRGRLAPVNGSVTRDDIRAIYEEAQRIGECDPPMTAEELLDIILGAIVDRDFPPATRAKLSDAARRREAARRQSRATRSRVAHPNRAAAAA